MSEERKREVQIRKVAQKLTRIMELDGRPLTSLRSPEKRLVGNCRDFSVMLCAILRYKGIASRARCGFGTYFTPGRFEDHWVCEYWRADERRWVMVDAQLDDNQRKVLQIGFDPFDVPSDRFLIAGKAWQMCRSSHANPDNFGIFDMHGMWFIRGNVVRDFLSLNKIELLPWDGWGLIEKDEEDLTVEDIALIDRIASLSLTGNEFFGEIRTIYEKDSRLRMPSGWKP